MHKLILTALLTAAVAAPAFAAERNYPVGGFDRVWNGTPFDVYVHTGHGPSVHAAGTDDALNELQIGVENGQLKIGSKPGRWFSGWHWGNHMRARIDVTVPMIVAADLSGPGNLSVDNVHTRAFSANLSGPGDINIAMIDAGAIDLHISGPGDIDVAGQGGHGNLSASGPGDIRAAKLTLRDATVHVSGPGNVRANVTGTADVSVSGPGDAKLTGGARCTIHKSFPGDASCS